MSLSSAERYWLILQSRTFLLILAIPKERGLSLANIVDLPQSFGGFATISALKRQAVTKKVPRRPEASSLTSATYAGRRCQMATVISACVSVIDSAHSLFKSELGWGHTSQRNRLGIIFLLL